MRDSRDPNDWRIRLARSGFARAAAFPSRGQRVLRVNARNVGESVRWLAQSQEHTNFTYELTDRNLGHMAAFLSVVLPDATPDEAFSYINEAQFDDDLRATLKAAAQHSPRRGLIDVEPRFGRRLGWYSLVRLLRPSLVVETGTDKGLGTMLLASALLKNAAGKIVTLDINPDAGSLIEGKYADVVDKITGSSLDWLAEGDEPIDLFIHDSNHDPDYEMAEFEAVAPRLSPTALVISDNSHDSDSLNRWAAKYGRQFLYFQEEPREHWLRGDGIGCSWPELAR